MITERGATIPLVVVGPSGLELRIEATVDTGYSEYISLPGDLAGAIELPFRYFDRVELSSGKDTDVAVYEGAVMWNGARKEVKVEVFGPEALIGLKLLDGYRLTVDVEPDGAVTITPLRR